MGSALFEQVDGLYRPSGHTIGPWSRELMHGGAVAALATTVAESADDPGYTSVRFTCELVRPLRLLPLRVEVRPVREGGRLRVLGAELTQDADLVARCSLTRIRQVPTPVMGADDGSDPVPDLPDDFVDAGSFGGTPAFFGTGMEVRVPKDRGFVGACRGWFRLRRPVLVDIEPSPMSRSVAAADFGNGVSARLGTGAFEDAPLTFVNASLDVHVARPPEGEWIRLGAVSDWSARGLGLTRTRLHDASGGLGVAAQTLVLAPRS